MAVHKPLVMINGRIARLPDGDRLSTDGAVVEMQVDEATGVVKGQVVYTSEPYKIQCADAASAGSAEVLGLVTADAASGAYVHVQKEGFFVMADWTAITGAATLVAGTEYYLAEGLAAGKLVASPPTSGQVVYVGRAIKPDTLDLSIQQPIAL